MRSKAQHARSYKPLPPLLKALREEAGMTQRQLGAKLHKPQSWVFNCEAANRRVDLAEFVDWVRACGSDPLKVLRRYIDDSR